MESTGGSDGGRWRWRWRWSSRRKLTGSSSYSTSSSRSGTIVSTATNTSRSGDSRISSLSTAAAAMHLDLEIQGDEDMLFALEARREARRKHIEGMVQEFFAAAAPSANCSGGDMSVLERWFTDLGVAWVLHLSDDGASASAAAGGELKHASAARRWSRALNEITQTIVLMYWRSYFPGFDEKPSIICEDEKLLSSSPPDQFQIAQFFQQAMLRMLAFVDAVVDEDQCLVMNRVLPVPPLVKLGSLLHLRVALCKALSESMHQFHPPQSAKAWSETESLLSAKEGKAFEAIWSTMETMRARFMEPTTEDSSGTHQSNQQAIASSAVHKLTESVMGYITFLQNNCSEVASVVSRAAGLGKYVPTVKHKDMPPVRCMIMEMTICLEQKLVSISESFPDQGLRFLFLLNNLDLMRDTLRFYTQFCPVECLGKTETYKERYLQVSWAPVLSSLLSPTAPSCLGRNYSPLSKFESEFQKTYTAQKLWKVQDPKLRKTLRAAVIQKIVPGYTKYIEDNSVATAKFPPKVLKEMLEELFEG